MMCQVVYDEKKEEEENYSYQSDSHSCETKLLVEEIQISRLNNNPNNIQYFGLTITICWAHKFNLDCGNSIEHLACNPN